MKLKFIENISLLKSAGIKKFITVDVFPDFCKVAFFKRKESPLKVTKTSAQKNILMVDSLTMETVSFDFSGVKQSLKGFVEKNDWNDAAILIGINEYKFNTVAVPVEEEEIDLWFFENSSKFLPDIMKLDEFCFSYIQYKEDESFKYFIVAIIRKDYLKKVIDCFTPLKLKIINCSPFLFSLAYLRHSTESNYILIDIEQTHVSYFLVTGDRKTFFNEFYLNPNSDYVMEFETCLKKIKSSIPEEIRNSSENSLQVFINCKQEHMENFIRSLKSVFGSRQISNNYVEFLTASLCVGNITNDFDDVFNFIPVDELKVCRTEIEKQAGLHFVLAGGFIIFLFVCISFFANRYLTSAAQNESDAVLQSQAINQRVNQINKDNSELFQNLSVLKQLKGNRDEQSKLLRAIPSLINNKTYLNSLESKQSDTGLEIVITGLSFTQENIADFMGRIDSSNNFKNVTLLYSSLIQKDEKNKGMIQFKISMDYNDN
jgi:Tfp pilus assembly protein PilN